MHNLPFDVLERIAFFADIDGRRSLGFSPRKITNAVKNELEHLLERKLKSQYNGYEGQTTTMHIVGKTDEVVTAVYITHHHIGDASMPSMEMIHVTGELNHGTSESTSYVGFNTAGIRRAVAYTIFSEPSTCVMDVIAGLSTHVTPYNYQAIMRGIMTGSS